MNSKIINLATDHYLIIKKLKIKINNKVFRKIKKITYSKIIIIKNIIQQNII